MAEIPAPSTPAAAAPAAAAAATPAPAAAAPAAAAAAPAAAAPATPSSLVGDAPTTPPAFDATAARAYLTEKGGKAEELAALDEAALKTKFDEAKAADGKPAEAAKAADIAVKTPEGFTVDEKVMGEFKTTLADASLSPNDRAQKLVDMHAAALKEATEQPQKFWKETNDKWVAEINADPEIGTANQALRDKVFSTALSAYGKQYGAEAESGLRQALQMTGAGNNPHIARLIFAAWKDRVESGPTSGKPADTEGSYKQTLAAMYPTANVP